MTVWLFKGTAAPQSVFSPPALTHFFPIKEYIYSKGRRQERRSFARDLLEKYLVTTREILS